MYKFVVFIVLLAAVHAKPGYLAVAPAATSHASRVDIIDSQPIVKAYAPYYDGDGYGYGGYGHGYGGYGHGYGYGQDLGYGYGQGLGYGYGGYGHGGYGHGGYGHGYGGYGLGYGHATSYTKRVDYPSVPVTVGSHNGYYDGYGHGWEY